MFGFGDKKVKVKRKKIKEILKLVEDKKYDDVEKKLKKILKESKKVSSSKFGEQD